jgi:hypothetical protein
MAHAQRTSGVSQSQIIPMNSLRFSLTFALLAFPLSGLSAALIDQNQPLNTGGFGSILSSYSSSPSQSFIQSGPNISGGGFFISTASVGVEAQFEIGLFDAPITSTSANPLVFGTGAAAAGQWADAFWSPFGLIPGATYYLGIRVLPPGGDFNYSLTQGPLNPYPSGQAYSFGQAFPFSDLTFRTFTTPASPPANGVPDSGSSIFLMAIAAVVIVLHRERLSEKRPL